MPRRVIVIAGPSCVGKTTLIGQLQRRMHRQIAGVLGLCDPDMWDYANARSLPTAFTDPGAVGLVLHYDILRPVVMRHIAGFAEDPGLASVLKAPHLCICSVWGNGNLLRERAAIRTIQRAKIDLTALRSPVQWWMRNRRVRTVRGWYRDEAFIQDRYAQWFEFVASRANVARHWVLHAHLEEARIVPFAQWSGISQTT